MRGSPVTRLQMAASEHVQSSKAKQTRPHPSANDESVLSQKVYGKISKRIVRYVTVKWLLLDVLCAKMHGEMHGHVFGGCMHSV